MAKKRDSFEDNQDLSLEEARALRASLYKPAQPELTEEDKREQFRIFWAQQKYKYGKSKDLEEILWLHLRTVGMNEPEKFEDGLAHFGLKKIR
jgi:hypothetical protein